MASHIINIYKVTTHDLPLNATSNTGLLVDTGASAHLLCTKANFMSFEEGFDPAVTYLELADGSRHANLIQGRGPACIPLRDTEGTQRQILLKHALFAPTFKRNILSLYEAV